MPDNTAQRLNVSEAAAYLGVSVPLLNKQRSQGTGPTFYRIGSRVVYDTRDLDEYLAKHRQGPEQTVG